LETRVLIAIPSRGRIPAQFLTAFTALIIRTSAGGVKTGLHQGFGAGIDRVRNNAVKHFLPESWSHLFFLDDDILPSDDAILRLLKDDREIVSGLYQRRTCPHLPIILMAQRKEDGNVQGYEYPYQTNPPKDMLLECDALGAGCLLIQRKVFEAMSPPWFRILPNLGEDIYFCMKAREFGFKVYVDTGVRCLHIVEHVAGEDEDVKRFETQFGYEVDYGN
jgi:GT2 family glycosyltransferase